MLQKRLKEAVGKLRKRDGYGFFLEPLPVDSLPDYLTVCPTPMDLHTMMDKCEPSHPAHYKSFDDLIADFRLIIDNCKAYNLADSIYAREAVKLDAWGAQFLSHQADRHKEDLSKIEADRRARAQADEAAAARRAEVAAARAAKEAAAAAKAQAKAAAASVGESMAATSAGGSEGDILMAGDGPAAAAAGSSAAPAGPGRGRARNKQQQGAEGQGKRKRRRDQGSVGSEERLAAGAASSSAVAASSATRVTASAGAGGAAAAGGQFGSRTIEAILASVPPVGPKRKVKVMPVDYRPEEDMWHCAICDDDYISDGNALVQCAGCGLMAHQVCYGIPHVPEGDWFCDPCALGLHPSALTCVMCFRTGSALKPTDRGVAKPIPGPEPPALPAGVELPSTATAAAAADPDGPMDVDDAPSSSTATSEQATSSTSHQPSAVASSSGGPAGDGAAAAVPSYSSSSSSSSTAAAMDIDLPAPSTTTSDVAGGDDAVPAEIPASKVAVREATSSSPEDRQRSLAACFHSLPRPPFPPPGQVPSEWAHILCASYVPEITIDDTTHMCPISNVDKINPRRQRLTCRVCKKSGGAPVQCSRGICGFSVHPMCARDGCLEMGWEDELTQSKWNGSARGAYTVHCNKHADREPDDIARQPFAERAAAARARVRVDTEAKLVELRAERDRLASKISRAAERGSGGGAGGGTGSAQASAGGLAADIGKSGTDGTKSAAAASADSQLRASPEAASVSQLAPSSPKAIAAAFAGPLPTLDEATLFDAMATLSDEAAECFAGYDSASDEEGPSRFKVPSSAPAAAAAPGNGGAGVPGAALGSRGVVDGIAAAGEDGGNDDNGNVNGGDAEDDDEMAGSVAASESVAGITPSVASGAVTLAAAVAVAPPPKRRGRPPKDDKKRRGRRAAADATPLPVTPAPVVEAKPAVSMCLGLADTDDLWDAVAPYFQFMQPGDVARQISRYTGGVDAASSASASPDPVAALASSPTLLEVALLPVWRNLSAIRERDQADASKEKGQLYPPPMPLEPARAALEAAVAAGIKRSEVAAARGESWRSSVPAHVWVRLLQSAATRSSNLYPSLLTQPAMESNPALLTATNYKPVYQSDHYMRMYQQPMGSDMDGDLVIPTLHPRTDIRDDPPSHDGGRVINLVAAGNLDAYPCPGTGWMANQPGSAPPAGSDVLHPSPSTGGYVVIPNLPRMDIDDGGASLQLPLVAPELPLPEVAQPELPVVSASTAALSSSSAAASSIGADTAMVVPPLGSHYLIQWAGQDAAAGLDPASGLSLGGHPGDGVPSHDSGLAASLQFGGWGDGDAFSELRHAIAPEFNPAMQSVLASARQAGICKDTSFRFARATDSRLLHVLNRVNDAFTCPGDFRNTIRAKNEFVMLAVRRVKVQGNANAANRSTQVTGSNGGKRQRDGAGPHCGPPGLFANASDDQQQPPPLLSPTMTSIGASPITIDLAAPPPPPLPTTGLPGVVEDTDVYEEHVVGFVNWYCLWFKAAGSGGGDKSGNGNGEKAFARVMYVATLQAVKPSSHPDVMGLPVNPDLMMPVVVPASGAGQPLPVGADAAFVPGSAPRTGHGTGVRRRSTPTKTGPDAEEGGTAAGATVTGVAVAPAAAAAAGAAASPARSRPQAAASSMTTPGAPTSTSPSELSSSLSTNRHQQHQQQQHPNGTRAGGLALRKSKKDPPSASQARRRDGRFGSKAASPSRDGGSTGPHTGRSSASAASSSRSTSNEPFGDDDIMASLPSLDDDGGSGPGGATSGMDMMEGDGGLGLRVQLPRDADVAAHSDGTAGRLSSAGAPMRPASSPRDATAGGGVDSSAEAAERKLDAHPSVVAKTWYPYNTLNPGAEDRSGTLLLALALAHGKYAGLSALLVDSTDGAEQYYKRVIGMAPLDATPGCKYLPMHLSLLDCDPASLAAPPGRSYAADASSKSKANAGSQSQSAGAALTNPAAVLLPADTLQSPQASTRKVTAAAASRSSNRLQRGVAPALPSPPPPLPLPSPTMDLANTCSPTSHTYTRKQGGVGASDLAMWTPGAASVTLGSGGGDVGSDLPLPSLTSVGAGTINLAMSPAAAAPDDGLDHAASSAAFMNLDGGNGGSLSIVNDVTAWGGVTADMHMMYSGGAHVGHDDEILTEMRTTQAVLAALAAENGHRAALLTHRVRDETARRADHAASRNRRVERRVTAVFGGEEARRSGIREEERRKAEEESDAVCTLCGGADSFPKNAILFCDKPGCNLAVHQSCYGIPAVPSGDWHCGPCAAGIQHPSMLACVLCGVHGGPLRPVAGPDGSLPAGGSRVRSWCHPHCARLISQACAPAAPVLRLSTPDGAITGLHDAGPGWGFTPYLASWAGRSGTCCVCGSADGVAIKCSVPGCDGAVHAICALECGLVSSQAPQVCTPPNGDDAQSEEPGAAGSLSPSSSSALPATVSSGSEIAVQPTSKSDDGNNTATASSPPSSTAAADLPPGTDAPGVASDRKQQQQHMVDEELDGQMVADVDATASGGASTSTAPSDHAAAVPKLKFTFKQPQEQAHEQPHKSRITFTFSSSASSSAAADGPAPPPPVCCRPFLSDLCLPLHPVELMDALCKWQPGDKGSTPLRVYCASHKLAFPGRLQEGAQEANEAWDAAGLSVGGSAEKAAGAAAAAIGREKKRGGGRESKRAKMVLDEDAKAGDAGVAGTTAGAGTAVTISLDRRLRNLLQAHEVTVGPAQVPSKSLAHLLQPILVDTSAPAEPGSLYDRQRKPRQPKLMMQQQQSQSPARAADTAQTSGGGDDVAMAVEDGAVGGRGGVEATAAATSSASSSASSSILAVLPSPPRVITGAVSKDSDDRCAVCGDPHSEEDNAIVYCDRCGLAVHQVCYGIPAVPEGEWHCSPCSYGITSMDASCALCVAKGGALKPTEEGLTSSPPSQWSHVSCALFVPEISFGDEDTKCPVVGLKDLAASGRLGLRCFVCKQKAGRGAPIQCSEKKCKVPYHVTCGVASGLYFGYEEVGAAAAAAEDDTTAAAGTGDDASADIARVSYCPKHGHLRKADTAEMKCTFTGWQPVENAVVMPPPPAPMTSPPSSLPLLLAKSANDAAPAATPSAPVSEPQMVTRGAIAPAATSDAAAGDFMVGDAADYLQLQADPDRTKSGKPRQKNLALRPSPYPPMLLPSSCPGSSSEFLPLLRVLVSCYSYCANIEAINTARRICDKLLPPTTRRKLYRLQEQVDEGDEEAAEQVATVVRQIFGKGCFLAIDAAAVIGTKRRSAGAAGSGMLDQEEEEEESEDEDEQAAEQRKTRVTKRSRLWAARKEAEERDLKKLAEFDDVIAKLEAGTTISPHVTFASPSRRAANVFASALSSKAGSVASDEDDDAESDTNLYCICKSKASDEMVACDRASCPNGEWFHFKCVGLSKTPPEGEVWLCPTCRSQQC